MKRWIRASLHGPACLVQKPKGFCTGGPPPAAAGHIAQAFACSYSGVVPLGPTRATHASHPVPASGRLEKSSVLGGLATKNLAGGAADQFLGHLVRHGVGGTAFAAGALENLREAGG